MNDPRQQSLFSTEPDPWVLDSMDDFLAARVVFADPPFGPYDYLVPESMRSAIQVGARVTVPLGRGGRKMIAWCIDLISGRSGRLETTRERLKAIETVLDSQALVSPSLLKLAKWISDYYVTPLGQVIDTIVPSGVRSGSGTREFTYFNIHPDFRGSWSEQKLTNQQQAVMEYLNRFSVPLTSQQITKELGCTLSPINSLKKRGLLHWEVHRAHAQEFAVAHEDREKPLVLNARQSRCLDSVVDLMERKEHRTFLLHGVTGSGKTEVYLQAIEKVIASGRQAIVLVPEISLTPQTRQRFRRRFDRVALLHSQLTGPQRHWYWQQIAAGKVDVVIGTRSAIFAPVQQLGLVIIDEEHDGSFKQDKAPRYHAREVAVFRAKMASVPLILGSATPSIEVWQAAKEGRFDLLSMPDRVEDRPLPTVSVVDMRTATSPGTGHSSISRPLHNAIDVTLKDDGQVILLLNRRGFSTCIQCPSCGDVVQCKDCDLALTHHRDSEIAICHFCDFEIPVPNVCPNCHFVGIKLSGLGTQKLEAEVRRRFPDAPLLRMDTDTMRKPGSHEQALNEFRQGSVKILLGTQMIAKGLDFPNVTLVGVINADTGLHMPDFRARERVFGLVTQVAGRTGRGPKGGRVIVQTYNPEDPAIVAASHHDYLQFAADELVVRRSLGYPPFRKMARIVVRSEREELAENAIETLAKMIQAFSETENLDAGNHLLLIGPAPAPVTRLRGFYRFHMLVAASRDSDLGAIIGSATKDVDFPDEIQWITDIDPMDMM